MAVSDPRSAFVTPTPDQLRLFFATQGTTFEKCLEPAMACKQKAIRAHSIQNAKVLDLIAVDGHVVMPQVKF